VGGKAWEPEDVSGPGSVLAPSPRTNTPPHTLTATADSNGLSAPLRSSLVSPVAQSAGPLWRWIPSVVEAGADTRLKCRFESGQESVTPPWRNGRRTRFRSWPDHDSDCKVAALCGFNSHRGHVTSQLNTGSVRGGPASEGVTPALPHSREADFVSRGTRVCRVAVRTVSPRCRGCRAPLVSASRRSQDGGNDGESAPRRGIPVRGDLVVHQVLVLWSAPRAGRSCKPLWRNGIRNRLKSGPSRSLPRTGAMWVRVPPGVRHERCCGAAGDPWPGGFSPHESVAFVIVFSPGRNTRRRFGRLDRETAGGERPRLTQRRRRR
jgi:hypothetical protein